MSTAIAKNDIKNIDIRFNKYCIYTTKQLCYTVDKLLFIAPVCTIY